MSTADGRLDLLEQRLDTFDRRLRSIETWATREHGYHLSATRPLPRHPEPPMPPPPPKRVEPMTALVKPGPVATGPIAAPRPTAMVPARTWSAADLEQLLTGRFLAWGGGLAI
ncbi:MAG: hypothetical protein M3506_03985, partial [Chloroflexota bacterium]|nr:hypothetical protein [Chloroflexota bacterium]